MATIQIDGGTLYYETRGEGPVLIITGSPMGAGGFTQLADALASDFTVITHDPRGISQSTLDDVEQDSTPDLRAADLVALLDALGVEAADVFGSSGGAVTGLALVARHPDRVRTLIAHEPPLLELLPDAEEQRAATQDIVDTYREQGLGAAFAKFMANAGFEPGDQPPPPSSNPEQDATDGARFLGHELQGTTTYVPDIAALNGRAIVVGLGAESAKLLTADTSRALASQLGSETTEFPGDHGGWMSHTEQFAAVVRRVLAGVSL